MTICGYGCKPCCDFCIHVEHDLIDGKPNGEPIACLLHNDSEHDALAKSCSFCKDFVCFNAVDKPKLH